MMKTIFVVDDDDTTLSEVEKGLESQYRVMTMPTAMTMLASLEKITPDLILLDIEMPEMNGFDALLCLKSNNLWSQIPVMFITGRTDAAVEVHGFEIGAVDFITKPFSMPVLLHRIKTHLEIDEKIRERTESLRQLQNAIVSVLADTVENRDKAAEGHIERITIYIRILIEAMKDRGVYADEIEKWDIDKVILSARLHDMGKIIVSDVVLNKPDKLTVEEYEMIKSHPAEGVKIIEKMVKQTGETGFLQNAELFAGYHHERWDGTGYPRGLKGTDIPLEGRIMAIIDIYDALVSRRSYKEAYKNGDAVDIISANAGKQFDPKIVEVFLDVQEQFKKVRESV